MAKRKAASSETSSSSGADGAKSTKAELIRQAAKEIGKPVRPRDIVAALKAKGVTVGYTQIAKALQAGGFHRKRGRRRKTAAANGARAFGTSEQGRAYSSDGQDARQKVPPEGHYRGTCQRGN